MMNERIKIDDFKETGLITGFFKIILPVAVLIV
jgi:hypothetical protein